MGVDGVTRAGSMESRITSVVDGGGLFDHHACSCDGSLMRDKVVRVESVEFGLAPRRG